MRRIYALLLLFGFFSNSHVQAQNVGIGEPNPGSKLSVKGGMSVGTTYSGIAAPTGGLIIEGSMGLGTSVIDSNAVLDMSSVAKGIKLPRVTQSQRSAINNPSKGLMLFDTDSNGIFFHNGTSWQSLVNLSQVTNLVTNSLSGLLGGGSTGGKWYTGSGAPSVLTGNVNDRYINTATSDYYQKTSAIAWTLEGNLAGQGYGATSTTSNTIGTGSKTFTIQANQAYQTDDRIRAAGAASNYMEGTVTSYSGTTLVMNVTRVVGSGTYSNWNIGIVGDVGATGATGSTGSAGPTGSTGTNGTNGSTGATGPAGATGAAGTNGTNGSTWLTGAVAPTGGQGNINDLYLNTATNTYYLKTAASTWTVKTSLNGATGATGAAGPTGAAGTSGAAGATGAQGIQGITGATGLTGAVGATGAAGTNGTNGAVGATGAQGIQGVTGATGAAGTNGTNGATGTNGSTWLTGTVAPTGGQGNINDLYLNTTTDVYYIKTAASTWTQKNDLDGVTGATGSTGSAGATGAVGATGTAGTNGTNGAVGATGAQGIQGATGATGLTGAVGATGATGTNGTNGAVGATGAQGIQGFTGTTGAA